MTSVGLFTFLMTLATVNVLPEPVTPSSVWCFAPDNNAVGQFLNRLRLVAGGRVIGNEFKHRLKK